LKKKKGEEIEIVKRKPSPTPLLTQHGPASPRAAQPPSLFTARPKRVAAPLQRYPPAAQLRSARPSTPPPTRPSIPLTRPGPTPARDASTPAPPQRALGQLAPTPARRLHPLPRRARTSGAPSTSRNARPSPRRDLCAASALDPHAEAGLPFLNTPLALSSTPPPHAGAILTLAHRPALPRPAPLLCAAAATPSRRTPVHH